MTDGTKQSGNTADNANQDGLTAEMKAQERLESLLQTLGELQSYLEERGQHTYELAQKFIANAQRDPAARAYDERQATMLEYQHYIWREIAGRVGQILMASGEVDAAADDGEKNDV
ncbi:MAG: hypothetical protein ABI068_10555 [Ktedonobacterales bacterium]